MPLEIKKIFTGVYKKKNKNDYYEHVTNTLKPLQQKSLEKITTSENEKSRITNKFTNIFKTIFLRKKVNYRLNPDTRFALNRFETIDLPTLNHRVNWTKRHDKKYVAHDSNLDSFIECLSSEYMILEHDGSPVMRYTTEYLDTIDRNMFTRHQSGKSHRYKIRKRRYNNESGFWMEVKEKIDGQTYKHRIFNPQHSEVQTFIDSKSSYKERELSTSLFVYYERMTFIHKTMPLKITIDTNLKAGNGTEWIPFDNLMILELKSDIKKPTHAINMIESMGFKSCCISKYCTGMVTVYPEMKKHVVKHKPTLKIIKKISKNIKI